MSTSATLCMERLAGITATEELGFAELIARAGLEQAPGGHHLGDQGPEPLVIEDLGRLDGVVKDSVGTCTMPWPIPPGARYESIGR